MVENLPTFFSQGVNSPLLLSGTVANQQLKGDSHQRHSMRNSAFAHSE